MALNHPERWKIQQKVTDPGDGTCIFPGPNASAFDCTALGDRLPQGDVWAGRFTHMRGFFVTKASSQGPQPSTGPQLTTATAGDKLSLQARVYNLSLAPVPSDANVIVRFMAMPWDTTAGTPVSGTPSFQIGQDQAVSTGALVPFNSDGTQPNWTLVSQTFDTGDCGGQSCANQDLVFWVVVWMQTGGAAPALMGELPEHGLRSIPARGGLSGRRGPRAVVQQQPGRLQPGISHLPASQATQASAPAGGEIGAQIVQVGPAHRTLQIGQSTAVAAKVLTGGRELRAGLEVQFYDGDPLRNAPLIGLQRLPHLRARTAHDFRVRFRPQQCGQHTVYAVAGAGTRHEHTATLPTIEVKGQDCPSGGPPSPALVTGKADKVGSGRNNGKVSLQGKHALGGVLDLSRASLTLEQVRRGQRVGRTAARRQRREQPAADVHGPPRQHGHPGALRERGRRTADIPSGAEDSRPQEGDARAHPQKAEQGMILAPQRCASKASARA